MRSHALSSILAAALASASGSACGMTHSANKPESCRVVGGDKLPPEVGGGQAICASIKAAMREQAPGVSFTVEFRVISPSILAATVWLQEGKTLDDRRLAVSDRLLNPSAINWFVTSLAGEIAKASRR